MSPVCTKERGALSNSLSREAPLRTYDENESKVRRVDCPRSAPSYFASSYENLADFLLKLLYAVAYASPFAPFGGFGGSAVVPGGIPRLLGSTVSFRSSRKVLADPF